MVSPKYCGCPLSWRCMISALNSNLSNTSRQCLITYKLSIKIIPSMVLTAKRNQHIYKPKKYDYACGHQYQQSEDYGYHGWPEPFIEELQNFYFIPLFLLSGPSTTYGVVHMVRNVRHIFGTKCQEKTSPLPWKNIFWLLGYPVFISHHNEFIAPHLPFEFNVYQRYSYSRW